MTAAAGSLIARLRQAGATLMCGNPDSPSQTIVVEINIATDSNTARIGGFFAEDSETGDIFLMHSGKIGGGRLGIGKTPFLVWSKAKLVDVADEDENFQTGIAVGKLRTIPTFQSASGASSGTSTASKRRLYRED